MQANERPDVIVVGAGAAGCVIAAGLARRAERRVLLLEAGPDLRTATPPEWHDGWRLPKATSLPDWGYSAEGDDAGGTPLRRGRVVGGTSWLTRFAIRGAPADFDAWAARGNAGWSWDDVLPAFRAIESDADFGDEPWHGRDGPLPITRYPEIDVSPAHGAAIAGLAAAGLATVPDHNRPGVIGVGRMPMSSVAGRRVTTFEAWIGADPPARLSIRAEAPVARVVVHRGRATGVELLDGSRIDTDEVVVCGGTYGSPAILLRSGVGPAADLRALGIDVAVDLPGVGANLADHPAVELDSGIRGPGAESGRVLQSIATWRSAGAPVDGPPDLMTWISDPIAADPAVWLDAILLKPASRGSVRLRTSDPAAAPVIQLPGIVAEDDVRRFAEALAFLVDVANRPEIRSVATESAPTLPGSPADLRRSIRENAYSLPHVVGTCAMAPDPDAGGVVDADGRVHGVAGLSVVDASILPEPPSGFPHLITIMAAEHLLGRWAARD